MHRECGTVTKKAGGKILVESMPDTGCASCAARETCLTGAEQRRRAVWMEDRLGARVGDEVAYTINPRGTVIASLVLYLLPVLLLITGAILGPPLLEGWGPDSDLASALGGGAGLLLAVILIRLFTLVTRNNDFFSPVPVEIESKG